MLKNQISALRKALHAVYNESLPVFTVTAEKFEQIQIVFAERDPISIDLRNDSSDFETIAHINEVLSKEFCR